MTLGDFSKQAEAYRRARPGYPESLLDLLASDAGVKAGDAVADFGAGTGIMTRMLIGRGFRVTAIEPNNAMREGADTSGANWLNGSFEASGLPDNSQNWAVAAQAFHWADPPRCLPEVRRILQPKSVFTIVWNNRATEESELLRWTEDAVHRHVPEFDEAYRNRPWETILESTGDFDFLRKRIGLHVIPMSQERFLDLWKSHNRLNTIAGSERFSAFFNELREHLQRKKMDEVPVPYLCEAWSARRVG